MDKMREEFEVWAVTSAWLGLTGECMEFIDGGYVNCEVQAAWLAWQASREALVIGLPPGDLLGDAIRLENENDQLKTENEALRQSVAGKVVCPLELFQDLRDSAADEAAQYRAGGMAEYRPHRMYALDKTVKDCDELIAAMSNEAQS